GFRRRPVGAGVRRGAAVALGVRLLFRDGRIRAAGRRIPLLRHIDGGRVQAGCGRARIMRLSPAAERLVRWGCLGAAVGALALAAGAWGHPREPAPEGGAPPPRKGHLSGEVLNFFFWFFAPYGALVAAALLATCPPLRRGPAVWAAAALALVAFLLCCGRV